MAIEIQVATGNSEQKIASLEKSFSELVRRTETLTQALGKEYLANQKLTESVSSLEREQRGLASANAKLTAELNAHSVAASRATKDISSLTAATQSLHMATRGAAGAMGSLWMSYGSQLMPMLTAFAATAAALKSFQAGTQFEYLNTFSSSLSEGAVSVATLNKELLAMKGVGKTPNELAAGFLELTKAGMSSQEAMTALSTASKYAAVGQLELGSATEQLVTMTNAFRNTSKGMRGDVLTVADTADIIAYAAQKSVASFGDIQHAFNYMTGTASTAKFSIQEVAGALMIMADRGLKGSLGATGLRTAFERLINPTEKASELFKRIGGNIDAIYKDGKISGIQQLGQELARLKNTVDDKAWSEFAFAAFGMRGIKINAFIDDIAKLDTNLKGLAESGGFVDKVFSDLAQTTKFRMVEIAASFERAFIKAFEGEKAREVLTDIERILASPGFANSLEHIMTGAYGLAKGFAAIAETFFMLPTWVAEAGIVGAFLFGIQGKLVLAGLIAAAAAVKQITDEVAASTDKATAAYQKNAEIGGKAYADMAEQVARSEATVKNLEGRLVHAAGVPKLEEQIRQQISMEEQRISHLQDQMSNEIILRKNHADSVSAIAIAENKDLAEMMRESQRMLGHNLPVNVDTPKRSLAPTVTEKEQATLNKLSQMHEFYSTYVQNLDNADTAKKLANIERKYEAESQFLESSKGLSKNYAADRAALEVWRQTETDKVKDEELKKEQERNQKVLEFTDKLNTQLGESDDVRIAKKIAGFEEEYNKSLAFIDANIKDEYAAEEYKWRAFEWFARQKTDLTMKEQEKRDKANEKVLDFYRELSELQGDFGAIDPHSQRVNEINKSFSDLIAKLKNDKNIPAEVFQQAEAAAKDANKQALLFDTTLAKLSNNPMRGLVAAFRDIQKETKTLGELAYDSMMMIRDTWRTRVGDYLVEQFGQIDGLWGSLWDSMLRKFGDFVADMVLRWAAGIAEMVAVWAATELVQWVTGNEGFSFSAASGGSGGSGGGVGGAAGSLASSVVMGYIKDQAMQYVVNPVLEYAGTAVSSALGLSSGTAGAMGAGASIASTTTANMSPAMLDAYATYMAAQQAGTTAAVSGTTAGATTGASTLGASLSTAGWMALPAVAFALQAANRKRRESYWNDAGITTGSFGNLGIDTSGVMLDVANASLEVQQAMSSLGVAFGEFNGVSVDAANNIIVTSSAVRDQETNLVEGMQYQISYFDTAAGRWKETGNLFNNLLDEMSAINPTTQEAIDSTAAYIATAAGVPAVADELSSAFTQMQTGMWDVAGAAIGAAGAAASAAAGAYSSMMNANMYAAGTQEHYNANQAIRERDFNTPSWNQTIADSYADSGGHATGGFIPSGSWGIVGEIGPEVVKGPASVVSTKDTADMMNNSQMTREMKELRAMMYAVAKFTKQTAQSLDRIEHIGIPASVRSAP